MDVISGKPIGEASATDRVRGAGFAWESKTGNQPPLIADLCPYDVGAVLRYRLTPPAAGEESSRPADKRATFPVRAGCYRAARRPDGDHPETSAGMLLRCNA